MDMLTNFIVFGILWTIVMQCFDALSIDFNKSNLIKSISISILTLMVLNIIVYFV